MVSINTKEIYRTLVPGFLIKVIRTIGFDLWRLEEPLIHTGHVHKKASLHFVIPFAIVAVQSPEDARHYFVLSIVSCYSLFPLLHEAQEYPRKVLLLLLHSIVMWLDFSVKFSKAAVASSPFPVKKKGAQSKPIASSGVAAEKEAFVIWMVGKYYLLGLLLVEIRGPCLGDKLPFVSLMLISIYCALAIMYSWIWQLRRIISST